MMIESTVSKASRWAAAAAVAPLFAICGWANGVVFVTNWDPEFNLDFSAAVGQSVGWRGSGTVDVDDGCLVANSIQDVGTSPCGPTSLIGFSLNFYDTNSSANISTFVGAGLLPAVQQLSIDGSGDVNGMLTDPLDPITGSVQGLAIFSGVDWPNAYDWELRFTLGGPTLRLIQQCDGCEFPPVFDSATTGPLAPTVTWERVSPALVPEPATLALVGIGLLAASFRRRRR